jgi:hypothetical protein
MGFQFRFMVPAADAATDASGARIHQPALAGGVTVVFAGAGKRRRCQHEMVTQHALGKRLAALKGHEFGGEFDHAARYPASLYLVPGDTLLADQLPPGAPVRDAHALFGGVVPQPFVATKLITHPLAAADAPAPAGWCAAFAERVRDVVLPGWSVFSKDDVWRGAQQLLTQGAVRMKRADGIGGLGQTVIADADALAAGWPPSTRWSWPSTAW